jgi:hypothetical protein
MLFTMPIASTLLVALCFEPIHSMLSDKWSAAQDTNEHYSSPNREPASASRLEKKFKKPDFTDATSPPQHRPGRALGQDLVELLF